MSIVILACFSPSTTPRVDRLADELYSSLTGDLLRLQKTLEECPLNFQWCSEAVAVVKKTHSRFLVYFERTTGSDQWEGANMVDEYMDMSLDLLDFCNLLKSAVTSLDRYRMMVDFMAKTLKVKDASLVSMAGKIELERNEIEKNKNLFMCMNVSKVKKKTKTKTKTKIHALEPVSNTMSILRLFIFCSIIYPIPIQIHEGFYGGLQNQNALSESVRRLASTFSQKLKEVKGKGRSVLHENVMIQDALTALTAEFAAVNAGEDAGKLAKRLDGLKNRSVALKQGIELFESVVNELFDDVIKGRKKVLNLITAKQQLI